MSIKTDIPAIQETRSIAKTERIPVMKPKAPETKPESKPKLPNRSRGPSPMSSTRKTI